MVEFGTRTRRIKRTRRVLMRGSATAVIASLLFGTVFASSAAAATVYELLGEWAEGTPEEVSTDDAIVASWWFNLNDDAAAPGNALVDDVTVTVTSMGAAFEEIPELCLVDGVAPASEISSDGTVLTCNVGSQREGSALTLLTPMVVTAGTNETVSASAQIADQSAQLPELTVSNPFSMDILWDVNTGATVTNANSRDLAFQWTLYHGAHSEPGPSTIEYDLTITNSVGATINALSCGPFSSGALPGHPWSGGDHPQDQMAPSVTCTLTKNSATNFTLTLTGIDYSHTTVPTLDSAGNLMPRQDVAVAAGEIWVRALSTNNSGQVQVNSSAPTYTAPSGATAEDDPANNQSANTWTSGFWSNAWHSSHTGPQLPWWSDTYRVAAGTEVMSRASVNYPNVNVQASEGGLCQVLDSRYVTFVDATVGFQASLGTDVGLTLEYYTGNAATLDPDASGYDPDAFRCGGTGGWSSSPPTDLSQVKAVRSTYPITAAIRQERVVIETLQRVRDSVPVGQDVWEWAAYRNASTGAWVHPNRAGSTPPANATATPDARYAYSSAGRDVLRVVGVVPVVEKSVSPTRVDPGATATFTLEYSAEGSGAIAPSVDDYELVDVLPVGMTYVPGSGSEAPTVTTAGDGSQTLVWNLDGVTTNEVHTLTYDVEFATDLVGGDRLVNAVNAGVSGVTSSVATASVVLNDAGLTRIIKTADQAYVPNVAGDGVGEGSWTLSVISLDPVAQDFVDVIDILPYAGDGRGTSMTGTYELSGPPTVPAGATVYYTASDPATLSDDPSDGSNGAAGDPTGSTVNWSTTFDAQATAIRVITGVLAPSERFDMVIPIVTEGMEGGDVLVNRAQGRAENTRLVMRTSAPTEIANYYSASLKKYVQDSEGEWRDANDVADYPRFSVGDTVTYRVVIENTGQGTLTNLVIEDDLQPDLGSFTVDSLAPGDEEFHEYQVVLTAPVDDTVVNTACASADIPADSQVAPTINCDEAGIEVRGEPIHAKELVSATPIGSGAWELEYDITVENASVASTTYSLDDTLMFASAATITSAAVTSSPAGVTLATPAWDGQSEVTIAEQVALAGNDDADYAPHVYTVSVVAEIPLAIPGAGSGDSDPTQCAAGGADPAAQAFSNVSTLTAEDGATEDDYACAPMPSISMSKSVSGAPEPNGDGTWTVEYAVVVDNDGAGAGVYDVTDRMDTTGTGMEVDSAQVISTPAGVTPLPTWTGQGAAGATENVIATDVNLAPGSTHTYMIEAIVSLDDSLDGTPVATTCPGPDAPVPVVSNTAGVSHNGLTTDDDACITVSSVTLEKEISSGPTPIGNGEWTIEYDLTVTNTGGATGSYDLSDLLRYGDGIVITDGPNVVQSPPGVTPESTWTGQGAEGAAENIIAADVALAAGADHTYRVSATVELDEASVSPADLECPTPGSGNAGGLANTASVTSNGIDATDDACAGLPLISIEKSILTGPTAVGDGQWELTYGLDVLNSGSASGDYTLADILRYGDGITVDSAEVTTSPTAVPDPSEWTGIGAQLGDPGTVIATDVALEAGELHAFEVTVVVTLDTETVTPESLQCPAPGSGGSGGLANEALVDSNGRESGDDACASLPLISIEKSVTGAVVPVEGSPGVYDVTYELAVSNAGPGDGEYSLTDSLAPGDGVTVVGIENVTTDAADSVGIEPDFDGVSATTIATDQPIAGTAAVPTVHSYHVTVRYSVNLANVEVDPEAVCSPTTGTPAGALGNEASTTWNGIEDSDDACIQPGKPTLDKTLTSATPIGDGQWEVVYELVVGNVGSEATTYDLDDELLFASAISVASVEVAGPDSVELEPGFDGATQTRIATAVGIAGIDTDGYEPHVYTVTVIADVPLVMEPAGADGDGPLCAATDGPSSVRGGFNNSATLTDETGNQTSDSDCAGVPSIAIDKQTAGHAEQAESGQWHIEYDIVVTNTGADGAYSLFDSLRFGSGIEVVDASVSTTVAAAVVNAGWTGLGEEGAASTMVVDDVSIEAGGEHNYRVTVAAQVDADAAAANTYECATGDSASAGFKNAATVASNGLSAAAIACDAPESPPAPAPVPVPVDDGLSITGAEVTAAAALSILLLGLGLMGVMRARRRTLS